MIYIELPMPAYILLNGQLSFILLEWKFCEFPGTKAGLSNCGLSSQQFQQNKQINNKSNFSWLFDCRRNISTSFPQFRYLYHTEKSRALNQKCAIFTRIWSYRSRKYLDFAFVPRASATFQHLIFQTIKSTKSVIYKIERNLLQIKIDFDGKCIYI